MLISLGALLGAVLGWSARGLMFPPVSRELTQKTNQIWPNQILNIGEYLQMERGGFQAPDVTADKLSRYGFNAEEVERLRKIYSDQLPFNTYLSAFFRGLMRSESELNMILKRKGLNSKDLHYLKETAYYLPGVQDLVMLAGKEVYSPELRKSLQLDAYYPSLLDEKGEKIGVKPEVMRDYWAGHWRYPSPDQMLEMRNRKIISESELDQLFEYANILPKFREPYKRCSYRPLSRVDVRRIYGAGLINDQELQKRYEDIEYSPEDAALMAEFTRIFEAKEMLGLSQAQILAAFEHGIWTREQTDEALTLLGKPENVRKLLLDYTESKKKAHEKDAKWKHLLALYGKGKIDKNTALSRLAGFNYAPEIYQEKVEKLDLEREKGEADPPLKDIKRWFFAGLIDEAGAKNYIKRLGFNDIDTDLYIKDWNLAG